MAILARGGVLAHLYERLLHKFFVNDLWIDVKLAAKRESVQYIIDHMPHAIVRRDRYDLLRFSLSRGPAEGLVLEFGVEKGLSINCLGKETRRTVHGFDSFQGLPADWGGTIGVQGQFTMKGKPPKVPANVRLHAGWFDATLPRFLAEHPEPAALIHVDCDIYESTQIIFDLLADRIVSGTVIVFDEYFNYPNWKNHEFKAFQEYIERSKKAYKYIGYSAERGHVAVQIL